MDVNLEQFWLTIEVRLVFVLMVLYAFIGLSYLAQSFSAIGARFWKWGRFTDYTLGVVLISHLGLILLRAYEIGDWPIQTKYECLSWFAFCNIFSYLIIKFWVINKKIPHLYFPGFIVSILSGFALYIALLSPKFSPLVTPLSPALQSQWYFWHVVIAFGAYAFFVTAAALNFPLIFFSWYSEWMENILGENMTVKQARNWLDVAIHKFILWGFPLMTFGVISGAAWADEAWGRYWSWDPFEIMALMTWTAYFLYLHAMATRWRKIWGPVFNLLGFFLMLTTFMGSGFLTNLFGLYSRHAY